MRRIITSILLLLPCVAICQSPIAYWQMNNSPKDASGNNNHGAIHGNVRPAMDRFGNPCGAYHFDGVSAYIEVPTSASLESVSNAFTIAGWYRLDNNRGNNWLTVLCKGISSNEAPDNPQYRLQVQQNATAATVLCPVAGVSGSSTISINTAFTECDQSFNNHLFEIGRWSFYALVYDGQNVVAYMNDAKVFEFPYTGPITKNQSPLYVGMDEPGSMEYFEGSLDDVYIFDKALNEQEIKKMFNENRAVNEKEEFEMSSPGNQVFYLPAGSAAMKVNFITPVVTQSACGNVTLKQIVGQSAGSSFGAGVHTVIFEAVSTTGYEQTRSFNIIVKDSAVPKPIVPKNIVKPAPDTTVRTKPDTVVKLPLQVQSRKTNELKYFEVSSTKLKVRLYDRGVFDGDTVSVYLNNRPLLIKHEVTPKGYFFEIDIDPDKDNELLFYAENLGSIPPNTAWMVIEEGANRYETNVLSSLDTNATIRIRKKKK